MLTHDTKSGMSNEQYYNATKELLGVAWRPLWAYGLMFKPLLPINFLLVVSRRCFFCGPALCLPSVAVMIPCLFFAALLVKGLPIDSHLLLNNINLILNLRKIITTQPLSIYTIYLTFFVYINLVFYCH